MTGRRRRIEAIGALAGLAASLLALALAPLRMPDSYSWRAHRTSESAAQGVEGAWLARSGFVIFGLTALWIVRVAGFHWRPITRVCFALYGVLMIAAAAFSSRPWKVSAPYDPTEDRLHSIAAGGIGTAFAAGVFFVAFRDGFDQPPQPADIAVVSATAFLPLGMSRLPDYDGLLQRAMFLIAYAWFGRELVAAAGWLDGGKDRAEQSRCQADEGAT